jgi:NADH-quinone oxidoreductase subunit J
MLFVAAILIELWVALLGTGLKAVDSEGAGYDREFGTPASIGEALLTKFLLPFELASLLLLVAAVGAVVLARRRRGAGIEDPDEVGRLSVIDALRPEGTGTMREGVSGIPEVERRELTPAKREPEGGW